MSTPGGQPEEPWEQRIRPAPRPVRPAAAAPEPEPEPLVEWPPLPEPSAEEPAAPLFRPDRSRMDPLSLDRSTSRKLSRVFRREKKARNRSHRSRKIDRWLMRALALFLIAGGIGAGLWKARGWLKRNASHVFAPTAPPRPVATSTDRILDMLESFLTESNVPAKAGHVLDRARVQPLMEAAYAKGNLPEDQLRFGVPQAVESRVWAVPAKVLGPPEFLIHLMVREEQGEPRLDWETYEQEISRRFVRFAARTGAEAGEFRLVLERAHAFAAGPGESVAVRISAPGSPALADPVIVRPDLAPALADVLEWDRRRRALVRLEWQDINGANPRLFLTEVVKWEFLP